MLIDGSSEHKGNTSFPGGLNRQMRSLISCNTPKPEKEIFRHSRDKWRHGYSMMYNSYNIEKIRDIITRVLADRDQRHRTHPLQIILVGIPGPFPNTIKGETAMDGRN